MYGIFIIHLVDFHVKSVGNPAKTIYNAVPVAGHQVVEAVRHALCESSSEVNELRKASEHCQEVSGRVTWRLIPGLANLVTWPMG